MSLCEVEVILHYIKTNQGIFLHKILFDKKNIMMNTKLRYIDDLLWFSLFRFYLISWQAIKHKTVFSAEQ